MSAYTLEALRVWKQSAHIDSVAMTLTKDGDVCLTATRLVPRETFDAIGATADDAFEVLVIRVAARRVAARVKSGRTA